MANANNFFNLYLKVNDKEAEATITNVGKDLVKLRSYTKNLEEGTDKWRAANKKLAEVENTYDGMKKKQREFINETKKSIATTEDQVSALDEFGASASEAFTALKSGDLIGFRAGMMGVATGLKTATKAGLAFLATPIGLAIAALAGIALATKEWMNYNEAAAEANRTTQQITQLSGDALDSARVRATAIEKTFGIEFKKNLEVASSLVNAFGISYEEAFEKIENGLVRGGKENEEFLKSLNEYPRLFAQAGFSVEDFQRIVNTGIDMKIYDDKLPDAIKEFSLAIMEETLSAREALENAFGKDFTNDIFTNIQNGSISSKDALGLIASEAEKIGLNAQQAQLLTADLFKGAGEDAGGALVIFEAVNTALNEQERTLTPLEEGLKRIADANLELEQAQDGALKSDKYAAWANDVSISWIKVKTGFFDLVNGFTEGIANIESKLSRFRYQLRGFIGDAFSGKDADWEKLGKEADAIQAAKEKVAAAQREAEKPKEKTPEATNTNGLKAQEEADKLREARNKAAVASEKKRLNEIENLQKEYSQKAENREAESASKMAELEKQRALEKAKSLGAEKALLDQIEAEHQVVINEAKLKEEEAELLRTREFEAKKLELENELRLSKASSDAERDEIQKEIDLEKEALAQEKKIEDFEKEMEFLKLTDEEKKAYLELMEENHQAKMQEIKKRSLDKLTEQEKKWAENAKQAAIDLETAKTNAQFAGLDALKSIFGQKSNIYKLLFLAEKGLAAAEVITTASKSLSAITANTAIANTAAVAASPLTGGLPWTAINTATGISQAAAVKINAGVQLASIAGAAIKGFDKGGYTDLFGMGVRDSSGHEVAGVVHTNEYVVPEVVRRDPEVPQILNYLESKRKKALGLYADGGDTAKSDIQDSKATLKMNSSSGNSESLGLASLLFRLNEILSAGIEANVYFGFEAIQKLQESQKKLDKIENRSRVKTP